MFIASVTMPSLQVTAASPPSLHPKTSYSPRNARRWPATCWRQWRLGSLSIRSSSDKSGEESPLIKLDRRNMLIGLGGGLYGTTLGLSHDQKAEAAPVGPPDLSKCYPATDNFGNKYACCPPNFSDLPKPSGIPHYKIPEFPIVRKRKAIQEMTSDDLSKFNSAIAKMKDLDNKDPWSFTQQSLVHCTFCDDAYFQVGFDKVPLQVHFSWLFLPWHRWYIYFFERILGKLIDDESVALPYWNYDYKDGMPFPKSYDNPNSSLYDDIRNKDHASAGVYVDLNYGEPYTPPDTTQELIDGNLCYFKRIFNSDASDNPELFIGSPLRAGETGNYSGSLENLHNVVHQWTGQAEKPNFNMGNFVTAAKDPIFYGHHSNVDRLWHIYRTSFMTSKIETTDTDWLDATFVFYDENKQLVKVNVRDSLDIANLGYSYTTMPLEWKDYDCKNKIRAQVRRQVRSMFPAAAEFGPVPKALEEDPIRVLVKRPKSSRSKSEIQNTLEVVIVDGIELEQTSSTRFDVFINTPENSSNLGDFAGSFVSVAHGSRHGKTADGMVKKLSLKLGITSLIAELNAEAAESLVVTLVPRLGLVQVGGVRIEQIKKKK